ncbi:uncharacterized protein LOC126367827 [Pectinophora gossypiella]|uniref:uncharacterized protein LOC126367827 n=1 Tax=Pectinophora gossypiella TaxID=13191 RepID=UPI00214E8B31|nr:uncharacterized protein LOC126367827 [Pectinophora gossypiella]
MKSVVQYSLLLFILPSFEAARFRCDYTYFPYGEGWYKLHTDANNWSEASLMCNLEGARLATPTTKGVTAAILSLINNDNRVMAVHTGLHTTENINKFAQEEETYLFTRNGNLRRASQLDLYPYICHKVADESVDLNECGTTDDQYKLDNRTSQCYKFHRFRQTFYRAMHTCQAEGGHLVIINSENEAQVIRDLFAKNPTDTIPGPEFRDVAFVGVMFTEQWATIQGQSLSEAGYSVFSPGEPNNARGDEFCASVGRNGMLFDDPCTRPIPFICEKEPTTSCDVKPNDPRTRKILMSSSARKFSKDENETIKSRLLVVPLN